MNIFKGESNPYSVERLRSLYAELLYTIDIDNDDLGGRRSLDGGHYYQQEQNRRGARLKAVKAYTSNLLSKSPMRFLGKNKGTESSTKKRTPDRRDLTAAFHVLSATPNSQKEGADCGALAVRDNAAVAALAAARSVESRVVELIRCIGEVVVYGEQKAAGKGQPQNKKNGFGIRADAVFEYFCEKNMLSLFVDIAKAKPPSNRYDGTETEGIGPNFNGVVWTSHVKAQVLQSISILLSNVQDATSLYYLLSNHYVNDLVASFLPMRQWTDPALEELMPVYVNFLKTLALKLSDAPSLFPFLKVTGADAVDESSASSFPIFASALEVATSSLAQSDAFVHLTCLNLLVNVLQISNPTIRSWVSSAEQEQRHFASHICQRLLQRYNRLATLTTGTAVDPVRSSAVIGQLTSLHDQLDFLNDVLWCGVRTLNVRICEYLLQRVVYVLLEDILVGSNTQSKKSIVSNNNNSKKGDIISPTDALAQTSVFFLSQIFLKLEYAPFLRMLAVAILHPDSPRAWSKVGGASKKMSNNATHEDYIMTPALNAIVQKKTNTSNGNRDTDAVPNPFRREILTLLQGKKGDWRCIPASILLESILKSEAFDLEALASLHLIPKLPSKEQNEGDNSDHNSHASDWSNSINIYLCDQHDRASAVSTLALECIGSLTLTMLSHIVDSCMKKSGTKDVAFFHDMLHDSPLVQGLGMARSFFAKQAKKLQGAAGVTEHFLDLMELAIRNRYNAKLLDTAASGVSKKTLVCSLSKFDGTSQGGNPELLVRKYGDVSSNDVEDARFAIRMALHYRALCKTVENLHSELTSALGPSTASPRWIEDHFQFDMMEIADDTLLTIGGLKEKPAVGTDLDLRGRTTFRFFPAGSATTRGFDSLATSSKNSHQRRKRKFTEDVLGHNIYPEHVLVLDPTDLFVVKTKSRIGQSKNSENRGTIIFSAPLSSVIAFAPDGEWLHIAIRQHEEGVGYLVKNGNMALRFESVGTCLIVRQYLERSRTVLQRDLVQQIHALFSENAVVDSGNSSSLFQESADSKISGPSSPPAESIDEEEFGDFVGGRIAPTVINEEDMQDYEDCIEVDEDELL